MPAPLPPPPPPLVLTLRRRPSRKSATCSEALSSSRFVRVWTITTLCHCPGAMPLAPDEEDVDEDEEDVEDEEFVAGANGDASKARALRTSRWLRKFADAPVSSTKLLEFKSQYRYRKPPLPSSPLPPLPPPPPPPSSPPLPPFPSPEELSGD